MAGDLAVAYGKYAETITPTDGTLAADERHRALDGRPRAPGRRLLEVGLGDRQQRPVAPGMTADGADEQALLQIERDFVTAAKNRDIAFFERAWRRTPRQAVDGRR